MKILLLGAGGQLGRELLRVLRQQGEVAAAARDAKRDDWLTVDLASPDRLGQQLRAIRPDIIVNAAAYTAVDMAEQQQRQAYAVNAEAPAELARYAAIHQLPLIHYSTDYVFDGEAQAAYAETDATAPLSVYGRTKLAGEQAVVRECGHALVIRTSAVYGIGGGNFVNAILGRALQARPLQVVTDQVSCPTWAQDLALASAAILQRWRHQDLDLPALGGIYHYAGNRPLSWYEFARDLLHRARSLGLLPAVPEVRPVTSAEFGAAATRPAYSVLDSSLIQHQFGVAEADYDSALRLYLEDWAARQQRSNMKE